MKKGTLLLLAVALVLSSPGATAYAQEKTPAQEPAGEPGAEEAAAEAPQAPEVSPEEQAMMEKWKAFATPGEHHERLAKRVAEWKFTSKMWKEPGAEPEESEGSSKAKMIMDGRYLIDKTEGEFQGTAFHGMGITGYDNLNEEYVTIWIDNVGTGFMIGRGNCDEEGVCTYHSEFPDPITGANKTIKTVDRTVDEDTLVLEMHEKDPEGNEFKSFEITYERVK